jgi:phosphoribosylaminoimidazole-succinocarboxamide synthase
MSQLEDLTLSYTGSVKNVWRSAKDPNHLFFEFTDQYSVFDWGKMPETIANKGLALTLIAAHFFTLMARPGFWIQLPKSPHLQKFKADFLEELWKSETYSGQNGLAVSGLNSHFLGLVDGNQEQTNLETMRAFASDIDTAQQLMMKVRSAQINRPTSQAIAGQKLYFYENLQVPSSKTPGEIPAPQLIPLEVIFRFGMNKGSSLLGRLQSNPNAAAELGFSELPKPDQWFAQPIVEFSTKLEPKDRHLSMQEAAVLSGLDAEGFATLVQLTQLIALALHHEFAEKRLELWDGKLEFLKERNATGKTSIILADSIGPDELRLLFRGKQLSKEFLREHYRTTPWAESLEKAQKQARLVPGANWKAIVRTASGEPPLLPETIKIVADHLYGTLANTLVDRALIPQQPSIDELATEMEGVMIEGARR